MKSFRYLILFGMLVAAASCKPAAPGIDRGPVRISWDYSSFQEMTSSPVSNASYTEEPNLYYPRAKQLTDGSLLLCFENDHFGWDIYVRKSFDGGATWGPATLLRHSYPEQSTVGEDKKVFVNPDFIQLASGRILLAWQWRYNAGYSDIPNTNNNCGVELVFSDDCGDTWSEPREIYRGRCWEPAFLELPSGEIQMYITDSQEIKDRRSFSCTSVLRSFDGGETWQGKPMAYNTDAEPISRTRWNGRGMDGMATAVLLDDGAGIVVPLETWSGVDVYDISPIVVRTTMKENWHVDGDAIRAEGGPEYPWKKQVNKDLKAFGPYSCKVSTGEMVILTNGRYKNESGVFVLVGDRRGDNFAYVTKPFNQGYWGSIAPVGEEELIATATVKSNPAPMGAAGDAQPKLSGVRGKVLIMKGRILRSREIPSGGLAVQPLDGFVPDGLWMLGKQYPARVYVDFGYTRDSLQVCSYLFDENIVSYSPENSDAAQVLLSRGRKGNYKITVNAAGDYTVYKEENSSWRLLAWEYGKAEVSLSGTINDNSDKDLGYAAKVSLPWELLGGAPRRGEEIRAHLRHYYKSGVKVKAAIHIEDMEGENSDYPGEWLKLTLK